MRLREIIGRRLARFLSRPIGEPSRTTTTNRDRLAATIRKGDVLLLEGTSRFAVAIKYLTQSTWSHAALCVSDSGDDRGAILLEADILDGVHLVGIEAFADRHTRICRPFALPPDEIDRVVEHAEARLGQQYDVKNIVDLVRYLIRTPPVPSRLRRRMLALGSGDPTRAICSSLIASAFQFVRYPILPDIACDEVLHIRHHSLFTPRDFDISPYFQVIKPTLTGDFDHHQLIWGPPESDHETS